MSVFSKTLSLLVPTHYNGTINFASILNTIYAGSLYQKDVEVIISDNSSSKQKFDLIREASRECSNVKFFNGPIQYNHLYCLEKSSSKFCLFVPDDDWVDPHLLKQVISSLVECDDPEVVGYIGTFKRTCKLGYEHYAFKNLDSSNFGDRILGLIDTIPIGNPLFCSVVRRDILVESLKFWFSCPNSQSWHDHIYTLFLVLKGRFLTGETAFFTYNNCNWDSIEQRVQSELKHIRSGGYPVSLILLQRLILAFEGFSLIYKYGNVQESNIWFSNWFNAWKLSIKDGYLSLPDVLSCPHFYKSKAIFDFYINNTAVDVVTLLDKISNYYDEINGSGSAYRLFWKLS